MGLRIILPDHSWYWQLKTLSNTKAPSRCRKHSFDRFLVRVRLGYPQTEDEIEVLDRQQYRIH